MKYTIGRGRSVEERTLLNLTARQSVITGMMLCLVTVTLLVFNGWQSPPMLAATALGELGLLLWLVERKDGEPYLFYLRDLLRYSVIARASFFDHDNGRSDD